jgi:hypothetical protein
LSSLLKIPVSIIYIFFQTAAFGGSLNGIPAGAGEAGMGYACVMKEGFWSSFSNQALLAFNRNFAFGVSYENRFGISELGTRSAAVRISSSKATLAAAYSGFGYTDYHRDATSLACGMKLGEKIAAGVQADYLSVRTSGEYGKTGCLTFEAGVILLPSENLTLGFHVFNPVPNTLRKADQPMELTSGAGIRLGKGLFAGAEVSIVSGYGPDLRGGMEYEVLKNLWLRTGYRTSGSSFCFGTGYRFGFATADVAFTTHDRLGITTSVSFIFNLTRQK